MDSSTCPHCAAALAERVTFCGTCGRPVDEAAHNAATTRVEPTPELLAAAKRSKDASQKARLESPSTAEVMAAVRPRSPAMTIALFVSVAALVLGLSVFVLQRKNTGPKTATPLVPDVNVGAAAPPVDSKPTATAATAKKPSLRRHINASAPVDRSPPPSPSPSPSPKPTVAKPSDPAPSPAPAAEPEPTPGEVAAAISSEGVAFVVRTHLSQARACYERAFKDQPHAVGGRVEIAFAINAKGKAVRVNTVEDTIGNTYLTKCLEQRFNDWQFPKPPEGEPEFQYPFVFAGN